MYEKNLVLVFKIIMFYYLLLFVLRHNFIRMNCNPYDLFLTVDSPCDIILF